MAVPKVCQLSINFRSHSKILDLANSIIGVIETLFPQTIDKLYKEKSTIDGMRPVFMDSGKPEHLF